MELRVLYSGVPIGTVELPQLAGLAHGVLRPSAGYEIARELVDKAGRIFAPPGRGARRYWSPTWGDFADAVASATAAGYDLEDRRGLRVSAASIVVFAVQGHENSPVVVVDFRPQSAHKLATLLNPSDTGGGRRRPAA